MKKLLTIFIACLMYSFVQGQSDIVVSKEYARTTIGIHHVNITNADTVAGCFNEFGFVQGDNRILHIGSRLYNLGPDNAYFAGLGYFDECHGHIHLPEVLAHRLYDECNNEVRSAQKQGFNIQAGDNFAHWMIASNGTEVFKADSLWLSNLGAVTPSILNTLAANPDDPNCNGSTNMCLPAGFYDTYGSSIYGQGIVINGLPDGNYYFVETHRFGEFLNQGLNKGPDSLVFPITITGDVVTEGFIPNIIIPPSNPTSVTGVVLADRKTVRIDWEQTGTVTGWTVQKYQDKGQNAGQAKGDPITVQGASELTLVPGKGKWKFGVKAVNCTEKSTEIWTGSLNVTK